MANKYFKKNDEPEDRDALIEEEDLTEVAENSSDKYKKDYDINVGHLVKSPCKECEIREAFPSCIDDCQIIEQIQGVLVDSLSTRSKSVDKTQHPVPVKVLE
jgi:hypothetical protein